MYHLFLNNRGKLLFNSHIKKLSLVKSLEEDLEIKGNFNELMQVFVNIINNAKDALKENVDSKQDRIIMISTKKMKKNLLEVKICDSGGGIKKKHLDKVFEPYFTTKHKSVGTGIGLSMAYQIITKRHKQNIEVENENFEYDNRSYKGACFRLLFKAR
ncbi:MAG: HAMP domain-containing sensor histidine kinase [Campylobacterota bacterium]|nr:HAMP domain-containing sensor histidine kinase [Campylobacterota bacterium]